MSKIPTENDIKELLDAVVGVADTERTKTKPYERLFKTSADLEGLLRQTNRRMVDATLDATTILREKFGYKHISDRAFFLLLALPTIQHRIESHIKSTQGRGLSVDKTYWHIAQVLEDLLKEAAPQPKQPNATDGMEGEKHE